MAALFMGRANWPFVKKISKKREAIRAAKFVICTAAGGRRLAFGRGASIAWGIIILASITI